MTTRSPIGAHIRVSGGLGTGGVRHAVEVEAEAVQVFVSNPQGWRLSSGDPREDAAFRRHMDAAAIPAYVHAPYLVNFGSPTEETVRRSSASLAHALRRGQEIGARGVVVHTGSAVAGATRDQRGRRGQRDGSGPKDTALRQVREHVLPLLDAIPGSGPDLLLEPMAGQGQSLCATVQELGPYIAALDHHPRLGVCLDTCHLYAAGHDLVTVGGVDATLSAFDETVGRSRLRLVHANDSADACGSRRDRHANIGHGTLGERPFAELINHPVVRGVPIVVETPGRAADHRRDVDALKRLRDT